MTKLFPSLALAAALSTISFAASADPVAVATPVLPGPRVRVRVNVDAVVPVPVVPVPVVVVQDVRPQPVYVRRRRSPPIPGLALLIGGACTLGTGAFNVGFGVERIREYGKDPFGIVSVSLGGTAMLIGLPITIVGIVRYANEPKEVEKQKDAEEGTTVISFEPTADGFALRF
jgi:hypothetical protein